MPSELLDRVLNALEKNNEVMQNNTVAFKEMKTELGAKMSIIKSELQKTCDEIRQLNRIVKDGNGEKPLLTRVALLEDNVGDIKKTSQDHSSDSHNNTESMTDIMKTLTTLVEDKKKENEAKVENIKGKWHFKAIMGAGVFTMLATLITAIIALVK